MMLNVLEATKAWYRRTLEWYILHLQTRSVSLTGLCCVCCETTFLLNGMLPMITEGPSITSFIMLLFHVFILIHIHRPEKIWQLLLFVGNHNSAAVKLRFS